MPIIGIMFWMVLACSGNHLLNASLSMDLYNVYDYVNSKQSQWMFMALYPTFLACYVKSCDMTIINGVCCAMFHLGTFMAHGRWPSQLLCGDPMNCWRGQYLYSHAIFY